MHRFALIVVLLAVAAPAAAQDWRSHRERHDGVHFRLLRSYTLPEEATASEPIVVVGGSATIDGHAEDDVVVIGGRLRLGPRAVVDGNVAAIGGALERDPAAVVHGGIDEVAIAWWPAVDLEYDWGDDWWVWVSAWGTLVRLSIALVVSILFALLAPDWIARIASRPLGTAGAVGVAGEVLFVPALVLITVLLVISIVGIPLLAALPLLVLAFVVVWAAGFAGVALRLGRVLRGSTARAAVSDVVLGVVAIATVTAAGQLLALTLGWWHPLAWPVRSIGLALEFVAWTLGLGAGIVSLLEMRGPAAPPVAPPPISALSQP